MKYNFTPGKIRETRTENGLTLQSIAASIGTDQSALSLIETGKRNPSCQVLAKIASALGKHPGDFFEEENNEENK